MTTEPINVAVAPNPPMFTLDLGANGGLLAPATAQELAEWIETERQFWSWLSIFNGNPIRNTIQETLAYLTQHAWAAGQQTLMNDGASDNFRLSAQQAQNYLKEAYINKGLPHSSSTLGKRVELISKRDVLEALAYVFTIVASPAASFDVRDLSSWRGFMTGVFERNVIANFPTESFEAARKSIEELHVRTERILGEKSTAIGELHRNFEQLDIDIKDAQKKQKSDFELFSEKSQKAHDDAFSAHQEAMTNLEKVCREKMTLRAPVEYWEGRQKHHDMRNTVTGFLAFGSMAALALGIGFVAHWVLNNLVAGKPELWRVAVLSIVSVLGIWAVRLVVRIFLSHTHLATDAAERVTMVKTYLALLEGDKLPSDDDRKLILQALFRPASDGIVKDEGLPHPALEALTRLGGR